MKQTTLTITFFLLTQTVFAQKFSVDEYAVIDKKALQIPYSLTKTTEAIAGYVTANFQTDKEKSRAIFIWLAGNIQYDVENMFAINFYEKKEDKIAKPLKSRKGICENYAALFNDICSKSGIKSFVIEGYTKQNGFADYIPHAWCAALIDSTWFMFDPTWGSGYITGGKFYKKINNEYFKADPSALIKSHIPFDYLWQFLNYPITNQEFYEGRTQQNNAKPFFNFSDSIQAYEKQSHVEQLKSSAYRIERNGVRNSLIFDRLQHIKLEIENDRQNKAVNLYNAAVSDYNNGINSFNDFINYRNKQFDPKKSDPEIQNMIDAADNKLKDAKTKLNSIENPDANIISMISQLTKSIDDAAAHVKEQQDWLKVYFSKGKSGRKSMFYEKKITWFGIPLN
ncbi:MAG TPA: transglutaminase domain-containing protein [Panacibacter sp.]|nr:transglutaminase domain-containing protein [Panacibacter sp.]